MGTIVCMARKYHQTTWRDCPPIDGTVWLHNRLPQRQWNITRPRDPPASPPHSNVQQYSVYQKRHISRWKAILAFESSVAVWRLVFVPPRLPVLLSSPRWFPASRRQSQGAGVVSAPPVNPPRGFCCFRTFRRRHIWRPGDPWPLRVRWRRPSTSGNFPNWSTAGHPGLVPCRLLPAKQAAECGAWDEAMLPWAKRCNDFSHLPA